MQTFRVLINQRGRAVLIEECGNFGEKETRLNEIIDDANIRWIPGSKEEAGFSFFSSQGELCQEKQIYIFVEAMSYVEAVNTACDRWWKTDVSMLYKATATKTSGKYSKVSEARLALATPVPALERIPGRVYNTGNR